MKDCNVVRIAAAIVTLFLATIQAQAPAPVAPAAVHHVDRAQLMQDVATLSAASFEGRATGSPGGLKARQWVRERFMATGLAEAGTSGYLQPFSTSSGNRKRSAANIVGRVGPARSRKIVITAHYDHLGVQNGVVYPGADDNASGVAAVLAAARYFAASAPRHQMLFAATDGEEIGLRGAHALIDGKLVAPADVALNVNLDMVSKNDARQIYAAGTFYSPWLKPILEDVQRRSAVKILFGHDRPAGVANGLEDWTQESDHGPFHTAGVPFVYFGVEDHPDYHKASDTADRIDPRFFGDVADMIIEALRAFDAKID
jgi:Zn-dependent M28 family amino/carboxypeptidase